MASKAESAPVTEDISIGGIDEGIDLDGKATLQPNLSEEELERQKRQDEYKEELAKIQEDIGTLRLVLNDKLKRENELKNLLGISFLTEMKQDLTTGLNTVKSTSAYQKTTAGVRTSVQKVSPGFNMIGTNIKGSLSNLRNSTYFKSFENGLSTTVNTVQGKIKNSQSAFNVDEGAGNNGMTTSQSTLGTTTVTNNVGMQETIPEDKWSVYKKNLYQVKIIIARNIYFKNWNFDISPRYVNDMVGFLVSTKESKVLRI